MLRTLLLGLFGLACLTATIIGPSREVRGQGQAEPQWIWFDEGDPRMEAPAETRYFRRVFELERLGKGLAKATLEITADNGYRVWLNGAEVGKGSEWQNVDRYDVRRHLRAGKNVLAVEARNEG